MLPPLWATSRPLTNQGFFDHSFWLDRLILTEIVSKQGCQVLSRSDTVANWANFWAFLSRVSAIAQHLQGSSKADALKDQFLKVEDSLNSTLQANMKLVEDNKNLKDQVLRLINDAKGLETCTLNVEALIRSQDTEISRL